MFRVSTLCQGNFDSDFGSQNALTLSFLFIYYGNDHEACIQFKVTNFPFSSILRPQVITFMSNFFSILKVAKWLAII